LRTLQKSTGQIVALFRWIQILSSHKILWQQQQQHVNQEIACLFLKLKMVVLTLESADVGYLVFCRLPNPKTLKT